MPALAADAVPDEATAIKIAAPALVEKMGKAPYIKMMAYSQWHARLEGNVWRAYAMLGPIPGLENQEIDVPCDDDPGKSCVLVQIGGWVVHVDRTSGKVLDVSRER
jgi:hypothetical protein